MPTQEERDTAKTGRVDERATNAATRDARKAERQAENERRKAAGQPPLPEEPEVPDPA